VRGRVFRRGAGWSYAVDLSADPATGKRRQRLKGGFHTKREAEAALAQMVIDVGSGRVMTSGSKRLSEWLEEWLTSVGPSLRPTTLNLYQMAVRVWITPRIGALRLGRSLQLYFRPCISSWASLDVRGAVMGWDRGRCGLLTRSSGNRWPRRLTGA
jgi:hypothetical protein